MNKEFGPNQVVDLSPGRRIWVNTLELSWPSHTIYGLVEVDVTVARRFIASFIVNQKRQALQTAGMKALRDKGKVEYLGSFEKWAPSAAAPSASAAQR